MRKIILISMVLIPAIANAQWEQVSNGMGNINVYSLANSGNNLFAGTDLGVYLSTNNGINWTQSSVNNGIISIAISGNYIYTVDDSGVILSTNNGTNWNKIYLNNDLRSIAANGNNVFAGTTINGVFASTNNGTTWTQTSLNSYDAKALIVNGNNVFAGDPYGNGIFLSTNNGISWNHVLNNQSVMSFAINGNSVFAGSGAGINGVILSTNNGINWAQTSLNNQFVFSLAVNGNNVFAGTSSSGVYISNNNGDNWTARNEGLTVNGLIINGMNTLCILDNYIFVGVDNYGVYRRPLSEVIGINPVSNEVPNHFSLSQNYPNPFNPKTKIGFQIAKPAFVTIKIFNISGQEMGILINQQLQAGTYETSWASADNPSGVYFYTMSAGSFTETRKMVLIK